MTTATAKIMNRAEVIEYLVEAKIIADAYEVGMDSGGTLYAGGTAIAFAAGHFYDRDEVRRGVQLALDLKAEAAISVKVRGGHVLCSPSNQEG
jgi:hypothetical protein